MKIPHLVSISAPAIRSELRNVRQNVLQSIMASTGDEDVQGAEVDHEDSSVDLEDHASDVESDEDGHGADPEGTCGDVDDECSEPPAAQWMSGKWGIGWRITAGERATVANFNVDHLVGQILSIKDITPGCTYVLFNLSQGAKGNKYLAPHSVLSKVNPHNCPQRDLFGELATAFQEAGLKVLVYMATEGPAQLKHGIPGDAAVANWKAWVEENYGASDVDTLKKAYAEIIVKEYAERYGDKIDGWWFDHAMFGNIPLLREVCKKANPKAVLGFNFRSKVPLINSNPGNEDFTSGHPPPIRRGLASSERSLPMVTSIEGTKDGFFYAHGFASLGHCFMPMHERWNSGKNIVWEEDQAVDWMQRVLNAGGAWTWNVPSWDGHSMLNGRSVAFAGSVSQRLQLKSNV